MPRAVVLTALPVEYLAVRKFLTDLREVVNPLGTVYEQGVFADDGFDWQVGIAEVGAGNAGAAIEAERAISHFKPDVLLFVGIAGGLKDDVKIGDVVAATKVYGYESGKVAVEGFLTRPAVGQSAFALVARARAEAKKDGWLQRGEIVGKPKVVVGAIAAGDKVLADTDSEIFKLLRSAYNDAIAVEMEGFGFLSAAFAYPGIKAIVIRGISDMVAGKNDDGGQGKEVDRHVWAANHASAFAFELLAKLEPSQEPVQQYVNFNEIKSPDSDWVKLEPVDNTLLLIDKKELREKAMHGRNIINTGLILILIGFILAIFWPRDFFLGKPEFIFLHVFLLVLPGSVMWLFSSIRYNEVSSWYSNRPRYIGENVFIKDNQFIKDNEDGNYLVYQAAAFCVYIGCKGMIIVVKAPPEEVRFGNKSVGKCSTCGEEHSYTVDSNLIATKKLVDWSVMTTEK
jgi:nucleoside phosphorylase